jgi:hypothetical protein
MLPIPAVYFPYSSTIIYSFWKILSSYSSSYEEFHLLGYTTMQSTESQPMFWRNMSPPSSGLRVSQVRSQPEALFAVCFMLVSRLAYFSTLTMEVTCSSAKSADSQQTTQHIPEDRILILPLCSYEYWYR